ncbi:hypothetical protein EW026_g3220 [Hermanssonia centrifuga]|uniref:Uncharacterized protein n=1 Tax=Hermanssonia centrifuga TaxID=98765 RepID=A0A4S4KLZ5_9APHY|nr:hypothetical protein EW026_g3220 [Hermanssonia centrifuga]
MLQKTTSASPLTKTQPASTASADSRDVQAIAPGQDINRPSSQLPTPSSDEILATLVKQKNIFPVMDALLRLVAVPARASVPSTTLPVPGSSTAAPQSSVPVHTHYAQAPPTSYAYPYYPYGYSYPYYYPHPYYYSPTNYQHSSAGFSSRSAPPPKRRKLTTVPAGAADWDVPYPFEAGQGPPDYQTNWERQRGQQLLEDLVGLVKSAAAKAAAKKAADGEKEEETREDTTLGSVEYYRDRVLRHYRPQTATVLKREWCPSIYAPSTATLTLTPASNSISYDPVSNSATSFRGASSIIIFSESSSDSFTSCACPTERVWSRYDT